MNIQIEEIISSQARQHNELALRFLKDCYRYVTQEWSHLPHDNALIDQGFERSFRETCVRKFPEWRISQEREMGLGDGLDTASGVLHEVDIVARHDELTAIVELKNYKGAFEDKNQVIVFFAKILDYLALNPTLLLKEVSPIFLCSVGFEPQVLAACLGLGIHPIAPNLRPLPVLMDSRDRMYNELTSGIRIEPDVKDRFQDFYAETNSISLVLAETWLSSRCGYQTESTIVVRAVNSLETQKLAQKFRQLNYDCTDLLREFLKAKGG